MTLPVIFRDKKKGFIRHFFFCRKKSAGFTLIELLIVIAVTLILAAAAAPIYGNLQVSSQLNDSSDQIIQTLRTARTYSISRLNNASHGVYFEINPSASDRFILYQGASYATRDSTYDRPVTLGPDIVLSTTLSGNESSFSKSLGSPTATGTVTVSHGVLQSTRVININDHGSIEIQ
jgi:prepilin-type N-terminal cleavage/methylation domain-containing protein